MQTTEVMAPRFEETVIGWEMRYWTKFFGPWSFKAGTRFREIFPS
jgi:hypothetical protein